MTTHHLHSPSPREADPLGITVSTHATQVTLRPGINGDQSVRLRFDPSTLIKPSTR